VESLQLQLNTIRESLRYVIPECILVAGLAATLVLSLIPSTRRLILTTTFLTLVATLAMALHDIGQTEPVRLFHRMLQIDDFAGYFKILGDVGALLTLVLSWRYKQKDVFRAEYYLMILAVVLGAHLLVMSTSLVMTFIALELISISSYVLVGFSFTQQGAEGSLKYFLFGAVASAIMLYGFSLLYGLTGTLEFGPESGLFTTLAAQPRSMVLVAGLLSLAGFLFKVAGVPMHPWAPDVYEAAPMPIVAFLSTVPKLAGIAALAKFIACLPGWEWHVVVCAVAFLSIAAGNFPALLQNKPKRLMAYSSIAQSGFLLTGVAAFHPQGLTMLAFYAAVYVLMNFLVFLYLQYFERYGIDSIQRFAGVGKDFLWPSVFCLVGLIALTGLPPTAGFTAKLFIFSSIWDAYALTNRTYLLVLLIFGLLNTVVSLFFYLKIPYYAFLKTGESPQKQNILVFENLLGLILVLALLVLFFRPGLLMGWINTFNFAV
jgi:NADH-quinone oxidoreductase subunit N